MRFLPYEKSDGGGGAQKICSSFNTRVSSFIHTEEGAKGFHPLKGGT